MSLILKGIDMPKEGEMIVIGIRPTAAVVDTWDIREVDGEETFIKREYFEHANIIQIPKGHGNLKDDKEILTRAEQEINGLVMSAEHLPMVIEWILDKSDTFLAAEE